MVLDKSKLLKEEYDVGNELSEEQKLFRNFLKSFHQRSKLVRHKNPSITQIIVLNREMIGNLEKIWKLENLEEKFLKSIVYEVNSFVSHKSLKLTENLQKNSERIKEFTGKLYHLIRNETVNLEHAKPNDFQGFIKEEQDLEYEFNLVLTNMMREIHDIIQNTIQGKPLISIIIPAYNEEKYIRKTLHSAKRQSYPHKEIIVVNNGSIDFTSKQTRPYTYKELLLSQKGISLAKNNGARKAKGDLLVFLDADSIMRKDLLDKCYEAYKEGYVAAIAKTAFDKHKFITQVFAHSQYITRTLLLKIPAAFLFIKRNSFFELGGFREDLALAEDVALSKKILNTYGHKSIKVIKNSGIITSSRRFEEKGYFNVLGQWAKALISPNSKIKYNDSVR